MVKGKGKERFDEGECGGFLIQGLALWITEQGGDDLCGVFSTNSENTVLTPHRVPTLPLFKGLFRLSVANVS